MTASLLRFPAAALAGVAVLGLAACGGSGSDGDDARAAARDKAEKASLEFARCMREHGVDMPDPKVGADGRVEMQLRAGPGDQAKVEGAQKACAKYQRAAGPPPGGRKVDIGELQERALEHARCMRENGVENFPDPKVEAGPGGGGGLVKVGGPGPDFTPEDPAFKRAMEACRGKLPGGPPEGPAPATPGAPETP